MTIQLTELLQWAGCATGVTGSALIALNRPRLSGWGFVAFLLSNVCWISYALMISAGGLEVQQVVFTLTSLVGVWRWLVLPRRQASLPRGHSLHT